MIRQLRSISDEYILQIQLFTKSWVERFDEIHYNKLSIHTKLYVYLYLHRNRNWNRLIYTYIYIYILVYTQIRPDTRIHSHKVYEKQ